MGLPVHVAFAPFTAPASSSNSLALAAPIVVANDALTAHVHIGQFAKQGADGLLFDKGSTKTPCELDIAYSQIESYLVGDGAGADVFIEPLLGGHDLRVDIALQQSRDGIHWSLEILLANCTPGALRTTMIPELTGDRARIKIRCVCPKNPSAAVRIWANEPRARHAAPPIMFGK